MVGRVQVPEFSRGKMVWYPSVDDIIDVNVGVVDATRDRHPHRLLVSPLAIDSVLERDLCKVSVWREGL